MDDLDNIGIYLSREEQKLINVRRKRFSKPGYKLCTWHRLPLLEVRDVHSGDVNKAPQLTHTKVSLETELVQFFAELRR